MKTLLSGMVFCSITAIVGSVVRGDAPVPVVVAVDPQTSQGTIFPEAEGLSYESAVLRPDRAGKHYFSPRNAPLIRLFRTLGIKSLRLGGVTIDQPNVNIVQADVDELFQFAQAANVKIIYSFRLKNGDIGAIKPLAKHIFNRYAANLDCIAIGNEPNEFMANYATFEKAWMPYLDAVSQENPGMKFCGPCAWKEDWARQFSIDLDAVRSAKMAFVAQHEYPCGNGRDVKDPARARDAMLAIRDYNAWYQRFVPTVLQHGLRYRLEETSNFCKGGAADVSDTYAAALWGLDYLYWWCSHQALGVNFHTGDFQNYSAFKTSANGYEVRPLAYGLLAFSLCGHGRFIAAIADLPENFPVVDLRLYAIKTATDDIFLTLINRSHGAAARDARVTVTLPDSFPFTLAEVCFLAAPHVDVAAKTGITVGGAGIHGDGSWNGQWNVLPTSAGENQVPITVPAATAAVLKLTKLQPRRRRRP